MYSLWINQGSLGKPSLDAGEVSTTSDHIEFKELHLLCTIQDTVGSYHFKHGILVDPTKTVLILSLPPPKNMKMLCVTLGHTGYYHNFICGYATINSPMEKLLKKDVAFIWIQECQSSFETLKAKMASTPILVFPNWNKEFHVHVDTSSIALGVVLAQPGEGDIDHLISFASKKLSFAKKNYMTT